MRYALRQLFKSPGFAVVALATLALGIGVNTTAFSVLNRLLLQPLPFTDSRRLVQVWSESPQYGIRYQTPGDYFVEKEHNAVFERMAVYYETGDASVADPGQPPVQLTALAIAADFLPTMGVSPILGRGFTADDQAHRSSVVLLGYAYWKKHFGGDTNVIGRTLRLWGTVVTIVGVVPQVYDDPVVFGSRADLWTLDPTDINRANHESGWYGVVARLKPGVTIVQAQANMSAIASSLAHDFPKTNAERGLKVIPFPTNTAGEVGNNVTWLVMDLSLAVLLIACVNLANLQLVRVTGRSREFAVRLALGAPRGAIIRMLMVESLILSFLGGGLGLLLAVWGNRYLSAYLSLDMPLNFRVMAFALAASAATGAAFGVAPAWFALRSDVNTSLKQEGRGTSADRGRHRFRNGLIVIEIALALILLTGAGFFIRGIQRISNRELGWRPENLLVGTLSLSHDRFGELHDVRSAIFAEQFKNDLQELPGVDQVAISQGSPAFGMHISVFSIEGLPPPTAGHEPVANTDSITPGFLKTYGMRLLRGRDFTDADRPDGRLVAIINESMAKRFWPGEDPIGKRIHEDVPIRGDLGWTEIVGVTNDIAIGGDLSPGPPYAFYRPFAQLSNRFLVFTLHSRSDPRVLEDGVRRIFARTEPDMVVSFMATAEEINSAALSTFTFIRRMLVVIAAFGLLLSAVGIYGVIANLASERTREIGIRMALGAQASDISSLFLRNGIRISFLGTAIGLLGSVVLVYILDGKMAMVPGGDPLVIAATCAILIGVALMACWLPARRAAKVDPLVALRAD